MQLRQDLSVRQTLTISPQFILAQKLLQLTSLELRNEIQQELEGNPILELEEVAVCPHCSYPLEGALCRNCGQKPVKEKELDETEHFISTHLDESPAESVYYSDEERQDPGQYTGNDPSLYEYLLNNFYSLDCPANLKDLAEFVIYSIGDHGILELDYQDAQKRFNVTVEEIKLIIKKIQTLDPPGIGAESYQEALLIQLAQLEREGVANRLARRLIEEHFEDMGKNRLDRIAEICGASLSEIKKAIQFISQNLNPYPANAYIQNPSDFSQVIRPSIVFKFDGKQLTYEVLELSDFKLKINGHFAEIYRMHKSGEAKLKREEFSHIKKYFDRARYFMDSLNSRKETIAKIAEALCDMQYDFLTKGLPNFADITQAKLAEKINLNESTVSRAMSGKFVRIPTGELLSFDFFFDSSLRPKEFLRNIIEQEDPENPISDTEIADILKEKGIDLARRTVAKYREDLKIPSSFERKRLARFRRA